jgi:hypothetical protein
MGRQKRDPVPGFDEADLRRWAKQPAVRRERRWTKARVFPFAGNTILQTLSCKEGVMVGYQAESQDLMKRYGFERGLRLLNVLTARDLGMLPEPSVARFVRENVQFFSGDGLAEADHGA